MEVWRRKLAVCCLLVLIGIDEGDGVRCYVCNSKYDPSCGDPFFPVSVPLVNCDARLFSQFTRSTMCKKETKRVGDGTYHIVRDCAMQEFNQVEGQMCMSTPAGEFHCQCFGDACNAGRKHSMASTWMTTLAILVAVITNRIFFAASSSE